MNDLNLLDIPKVYPELVEKCKEIGFTMPSDLYIGTLLKTLISSKPKSNILELGTGISLSLSWMIDGLDDASKLISIDNDPELIKIAKEYFGNDKRVELICADAAEWIKSYSGSKFDLIFADAWPGKYTEIDKTLELVNIGGFYVIDDMLPQPNWIDGHQENVNRLIDYLENRDDFCLTKMNWSTGIIIATKKGY